MCCTWRGLTKSSAWPAHVMLITLKACTAVPPQSLSISHYTRLPLMA